MATMAWVLAGALVQSVGFLSLSPRKPGSLGEHIWWLPGAIALFVAGMWSGWMGEDGSIHTFSDFAYVYSIGLGLGFAVASFVCGIMPRVDETTVLVATALYWFLLVINAIAHPFLAVIGAAIAIMPTIRAVRSVLSREALPLRERVKLFAWWLFAMIVIGLSLVTTGNLFFIDTLDLPATDAFVGGMVIVGVVANATGLLAIASGVLLRQGRQLRDAIGRRFGEEQAPPIGLFAGLLAGLAVLFANEAYGTVSTGVAVGIAYAGVPLLSDLWHRFSTKTASEPEPEPVAAQR